MFSKLQIEQIQQLKWDILFVHSMDCFAFSVLKRRFHLKTSIILCTLVGLQQLNTRQHKKQGKPVTAEFKPSSTAKQEPPPLEFEDEEGPTKIEASNVDRKSVV